MQSKVRGVPLEIISDRLYWISDSKPPKSNSSAYFFSIDDDLVYEPFSKDFGPLDLAKMHRFCHELEKLVTNKKYASTKTYHYTSLKKEKQPNAAFLMGAFMIIVLKKSAQEAFDVFEPYANQFEPFRDASLGVCTYKCTVLDCLQGLEYAINLGWYDYNSFDAKEYEHYEKVHNGDLNWIMPGKFLAFAGPSKKEYDEDGYRTFTPEDYAPIFKKIGVTTVIRLNNKVYDRERFLKKGFNHIELFFVDGTTPKLHIVDEFLKIAENEEGGIAIHCKAGLGRTGSLIALYCMKHYAFPAAAFIGWIRICRPGSILGPQQHYLCKMQDEMFERGRDLDTTETLIRMGSLTLEEKDIGG